MYQKRYFCHKEELCTGTVIVSHIDYQLHFVLFIIYFIGIYYYHIMTHFVCGDYNISMIDEIIIKDF
jgi:hypothetical protein